MLRRSRSSRWKFAPIGRGLSRISRSRACPLPARRIASISRSAASRVGRSKRRIRARSSRRKICGWLSRSSVRRESLTAVCGARSHDVVDGSRHQDLLPAAPLQPLHPEVLAQSTTFGLPQQQDLVERGLKDLQDPLIQDRGPRSLSARDPRDHRRVVPQRERSPRSTWPRADPLRRAPVGGPPSPDRPRWRRPPGSPVASRRPAGRRPPARSGSPPSPRSVTSSSFARSILARTWRPRRIKGRASPNGPGSMSRRSMMRSRNQAPRFRSGPCISPISRTGSASPTTSGSGDHVAQYSERASVGSRKSSNGSPPLDPAPCRGRILLRPEAGDLDAVRGGHHPVGIGHGGRVRRCLAAQQDLETLHAGLLPRPVDAAGEVGVRRRQQPLRVLHEQGSIDEGLDAAAPILARGQRKPILRGAIRVPLADLARGDRPRTDRHDDGLAEFRAARQGRGDQDRGGEDAPRARSDQAGVILPSVRPAARSRSRRCA